MDDPIFEEVDIDSIKPWDKNPRFIKDDQFRKLCDNIIKDPEFMKNRPILVNCSEGGNKVIYAGNMRWRACKELGWEKVPVVIDTDLPEKIMKRRMLLDNAHHGEFDLDMLANAFDVEEMVDVGLDDVLNQIENLSVDIVTNKEEEEEEVPALQKDTSTEVGEVYQLGEHRLVCGDSFSKENMVRLMNNDQANLLLTDPPYGINKKEIKNDESEMLNKVFTTITDWYDVFCAENSSGYVFGMYPQLYGLYTELLAKNFYFIQNLYWMKGACRSVKNQYRSFIENILFFTKDKEKYQFNSIRKDWKEFKWLMNPSSIEIWEEMTNSSYAEVKKRFDEKRGKRFHSKAATLTNIFKYSTSMGFWKKAGGKEFFEGKKQIDHHPTMKPVGLLEDFLNQSTKENDIVLDFFGGSGSTLIACENLNRKCYMMELDPHYVDVIIKRWENHTDKKAQKVS